MCTLCTKSRYGIDLLGTLIKINCTQWEVGALIQQKYENGLLCQWWLLLTV